MIVYLYRQVHSNHPTYFVLDHCNLNFLYYELIEMIKIKSNVIKLNRNYALEVIKLYL